MEYWWKNVVIYEVYVDKFAKNFRGMTEKLGYLKDLGIDCIWLLPHYPSPMVDGGYDVSNYMDVRPELGTLDDFSEFINKAHEMGIRIIVDFVLNHVSVEHPWFREASSSRENPKRDYFLWSETGKGFDMAYNPFSHMTQGNWKPNKETGDYYYATFFDSQADLNWDNPEVFDECTRIIDFWAKLGVDGFRLDAVGHLIKREGTDCRHLPEVHEILRRLRSHLDKNWPGVVFLAEAGGHYRQTMTYFGNGDECHMVFHFGLMSYMYLALKREDPLILKKVVDETSDIPENCQWATFISNHDEVTFTPLDELEREEIVFWLDPDNKYSFRGGRGVSMRLATIFDGDKDKICNLFKTLFDLEGSPVIYYGSEIGMRNLEMDKRPLDSRKYVRGDFSWDEAMAQLKDKDSIYSRLKQLIVDRKKLRI